MAAVILDALLLTVSFPVALATTYLFVLTVTSRRAPSRRAEARRRFDIIVVARGDAGVASTLASLSALDYPAALRRVLVVAEGSEEHESDAPSGGGELAAAFARCGAEGVADAIVVMGAGAIASPSLLRALSAQVDSGACAIQVRRTVRDLEASWRARLMAIACCLFDRVRSLGRERLGLSPGLRGGGCTCFTADLLRGVPPEAYLGLERVEGAIRLALAGFRVSYCDDAVIYGESASGGQISSSAHRWHESSRRQVRRTWAPILLREAVHCHSQVLADLFIDVMMPPLGAIAFSAGCGLLLSIGLSALVGHTMCSVYGWALCAIFLGAYIGRGIWLAGLGFRGFATLMGAPVYLAWKTASRVLGGAKQGSVQSAPDASATP